MKGKTITLAESIRRERENKKIFPLSICDEHNDAGRVCECCKRPETAGDCLEDIDNANVCNLCYWTRDDKVADYRTHTQKGA